MEHPGNSQNHWNPIDEEHARNHGPFSFVHGSSLGRRGRRNRGCSVIFGASLWSNSANTLLCRICFRGSAKAPAKCSGTCSVEGWKSPWSPSAYGLLSIAGCLQSPWRAGMSCHRTWCNEHLKLNLCGPVGQSHPNSRTASLHLKQYGVRSQPMLAPVCATLVLAPLVSESLLPKRAPKLPVEKEYKNKGNTFNSERDAQERQSTKSTR